MAGKSSEPMVEFRVDTREIRDLLPRYLTALERRQINFAKAASLTKAAKYAQEHIRNRMRNTFDRPKPFTLNSLRVEPAKFSRSKSINKMSSAVHFKDDLSMRTGFKNVSIPAAKYLQAEIGGGPRSVKRMESQLRHSHLLAPGQFLIPGKRAELDQYGNFTASQITRIFSSIGGFGEVGYKMNQTGTSRGRAKKQGRKPGRYFFGRPPGVSRLGIWERDEGKRVKPIMIVVDRAPRYRVRLPFAAIASKVGMDHFFAIFPFIFAKAVREARVKGW